MICVGPPLFHPGVSPRRIESPVSEAPCRLADGIFCSHDKAGAGKSARDQCAEMCASFNTNMKFPTAPRKGYPQETHRQNGHGIRDPRECADKNPRGARPSALLCAWRGTLSQHTHIYNMHVYVYTCTHTYIHIYMGAEEKPQPPNAYSAT